MITYLLGSCSKVALAVEGLLAPWSSCFLVPSGKESLKGCCGELPPHCLSQSSTVCKCNLRFEIAHKQITHNHRYTSSHWLISNKVTLCAINPVPFPPPLFLYSYCCTPYSSNHPRLVILHYKFRSHFHKPLMLHASGGAYLLPNKSTPLPLSFY